MSRAAAKPVTSVCSKMFFLKTLTALSSRFGLKHRQPIGMLKCVADALADAMGAPSPTQDDAALSLPRVTFGTLEDIPSQRSLITIGKASSALLARSSLQPRETIGGP